MLLWVKRIKLGLVLIIILAIGLTACTSGKATFTPISAGPGATDYRIEQDIVEAPEEVLQAARQLLLERLNTTAAEITVVSAKAVQWRDSSLGCPRPGVGYLQVITSGFWVELEVKRTIYSVHTNQDGSQAVLCEVVSPDASNAPLNDIGWLLDNLNGQTVISNTQITLDFENGALNGSDGCNQYSGSYTADGERITVNNNIATTMMACAEPIMQQASVYITALTQATAYKVAGQQLTLLDAGGKTLAIFIQQSREN
ncbi:MAG: META domain-containing protein [Anaerolineae bacterium]|nr:META domain-containing protein [Anaerolineae bacterium]